MSSVKERIFGAVTIMNEEDAQKVWELIQATFMLANAETVPPDAEESQAFTAYINGETDYSPAISHEDLIKELGI